MKRILKMLFISSVLFGGCTCNKKPVDPIVPVPAPAPAPAPTPTPVVKNATVVIHFHFNSHRLLKGQKVMLKEAMAARQPGSTVTIVGYTDSQGTKQYNQKLSVKRARAVSRFLTHLNVKNTWSADGENDLLNVDKTIPQHEENRRAMVGFTVLAN